MSASPSQIPFAGNPSDSTVQPQIRITARGAERLQNGHVWVYQSDLTGADRVPAGSLVRVCDYKGKFQGMALYSNASQIAIRMLTNALVGKSGAGSHAENTAEIPDEAALLRLLQQRIMAACAYRRKIVTDSDACRLIFSEADGLPGLIVDKYSEVLSVQLLTQAMDREPIRRMIVDTLLEQTGAVGIAERVDPRVRELEHLPARESRLLAGEKAESVFAINQSLDRATSGKGGQGVRFRFHALEGQKTGAFLDQRENYAAAAHYGHGEALDVCTYQGGFALHLARVCSQVTAVDSSRPALEVAEQNEELNSGTGRAAVEWIEANAFDLLKDYSASGRQYDTIVLDPPAFAKTKKNLETAVRGYKELNLRALKMLRPGGVLVTCSCSYHMSEADFVAVLASAAADAHRRVRIVEKRGQAKDHPVLLNVAETGYLKCLICEVMD